MTKSEKMSKLKTRAPELDILRGIAVLLMMFDHFMYDSYEMMGYFFDGYGKTGWTAALSSFARQYWAWDLRFWVRQFILFIFLGLTGICCSFSRSNLKRGLKLMAVAAALSGITYVFSRVLDDSEMWITFGAIACIAFSLIVVGLLELVLSGHSFGKWIYLVLGIVMVSFGFYLNSKSVHVNFGKENLGKLLWQQFVGITESGGDSFPFLLYGGEVFLGVFLGKMFYKDRKSVFKNAVYHNNLLTFIGRNSLVVYFAHQIIIPLLFGIVLVLFGFRLTIFG